MEILSNFLLKVDKRDGYHAECYAHFCPACNCLHAFAVDTPFHNGARWTFDGNAEKPTFSPSMNIGLGPFPQDGRIERCHYFLKAGQLEYLPDCTHALAGQTVALPAFAAEKLEGYRTVMKMHSARVR